MKRFISIILFALVLVVTAASQGPTITQTGQFIVGLPDAHDIKFWGDDIIASRYSYESGSPFPFHEELILMNKFGEIIWNKEFAPRNLGARNNIVIVSSNLFCIFTLGDTIYKINKAGELLKKKFLNSTIVETALLSSGEIVTMEVNMASAPSRFFVYNEELDLIRVISVQRGATNSVSQLRDVYFVSGTKYGGGVFTNGSSHIARYDTTGNLLWLKEFPDVINMRLVVNLERLYFCGIYIGTSHQKMTYGELKRDSGDTLWVKTWGAPYPDTLVTLLGCKQLIGSPDGGFMAIGLTTYPGQQILSYEPNLQAGLVLGYSPNLDYPWVKTGIDVGWFMSGDWQDSSLVVCGNMGSPMAAQAIIYSISGLTAIEDDEAGPKDLSLGQNYPNPFNPLTKIEFSLAEAGLTSLKVYDLLGREVATLVSEELLAGKYEVSFEASSLASGMYIYTLSVGRNTVTRKMVLLR